MMAGIIPVILIIWRKELLSMNREILEGYTASRLPIKVIYVEAFASRAEAIEAERKIKDWSRKKKEALAYRGWQGLVDLKEKIKI